MKINRNKFLVAGAAGLGAVPMAATQGRAAQFEWRCSSSQAVDHPNSVRLSEMWKAIDRETSGRLKVGYFPNSQLGGDAAMLSQTRLGAIQFNFINPGNITTVVPAIDIMNLGFSFNDAQEGLHAMSSPFGEYMRKETAAKGLVAVDMAWNTGMLSLGNSRNPVHGPDDLKGMKIRTVPSKIVVDLFKAFDASAVPVALAETYTALQTKLVDGAATSVVTWELSGFYEVGKHFALTQQVWGAMWLTANADAWKSLPPDIQDVVTRNAQKYGTLERRDINILTEATIDKLGRQGVQVTRINPSAFRARLHSYYETWASAFGSTTWTLLENALGRKLT